MTLSEAASRLETREETLGSGLRNGGWLAPWPGADTGHGVGSDGLVITKSPGSAGALLVKCRRHSPGSTDDL